MPELTIFNMALALGALIFIVVVGFVFGMVRKVLAIPFVLGALAVVAGVYFFVLS